jgi:uncharacterized membrane protein
MRREKTKRTQLRNLVGGAAAGALAYYFFDGTAGRQRRRRLRDKLYSVEKRAESELARSARDLSNRAQGVAAILMHAKQTEAAPDEVVAERVRARIGHLLPHSVEVQACNGEIVLEGSVPRERRERLLQEVKHVRGVHQVIDRLEASDEPIPPLRPRRFIEIQKTLHVRAPIEAVYHYFTDFQTFPRFMRHVRHIELIDEKKSRWTVDGPFGMPVVWEAELEAIEPNQRISWRSVMGALVEHEGEVRFEKEGEGTRLQIRIGYRPPFGIVGHVIALFSGRDPKRELDDDMLRFKSLMEEGKARGRGDKVTRQELEAQRPQFS